MTEDRRQRIEDRRQKTDELAALRAVGWTKNRALGFRG
jgi:hypothetical protein